MFSVAKLRLHPTVTFANEFKFCNDWWHTHQLARAGMKFANVREAVVAYRRHPASDGPANRDAVVGEQFALKMKILADLGFYTEHNQVLHDLIHLEGADLFAGLEREKQAVGDWLLSLMRQNDHLGALPQAEFSALIHSIWHRIFHP